MEWEQERTLHTNYAANKLVLDPNEGFGRNHASMPLKTKEQREAAGEDVETFSDDDGEPLRMTSCDMCVGGDNEAWLSNVHLALLPPWHHGR